CKFGFGRQLPSESGGVGTLLVVGVWSSVACFVPSHAWTGYPQYQKILLDRARRLARVPAYP
ncbi:hypothetical protein BV20DRAFT_963834, partial [Pilatotrama ljubarskyi]